MKITRIESWRERVPLTRPYTIASKGTTSEVDLFFVRITSDSPLTGVGSASPAEHVTGESAGACEAALRPERLEEALGGRDPRQFGALCRIAEETLGGTPAAQAAVDMALHDLFGRLLETPVVDLLGRRIEALPTSVTIGIKPAVETLAEAHEYLGRGFRCLKVKIGRDLEEDVERLRELRDRAGPGIRIRVDANQGYTLDEAVRLDRVAGELDLELVEQPLPARALDDIRRLPPSLRDRIALDESLQTERDALRHARPPSAAVYVIKLMKCGGITKARGIARIAEVSGRALMWGSMDESALSITAALHAAYASPATRLLDLDGSFDLSRDPAEGGFELRNGCLHLTGGPGLDVRLR